ncbi:type I glyceraldehyde-3-phosphate dehydrogenase [Candidatus Peregrinibacteria bacterium HGW-Peregrinibacteria-1]|jgi:glyceraldehyde 3-phosphate dehydrogenase|nr:MAG: type I glyceraldehyde-3-phosphate dehydrogenase [Candidatus Peregrinibacteria bacterium HGW-Peregrinibacteria-1]
MKPRVAINGFGRIGRQVYRINLLQKKFNIVAINDLTDAETLAHLLKYDSTYGTIPNAIEHKKDQITVDKQTSLVFSEPNPENLPWKKLKIDIVIEATGHFTTRAGAQKHIDAGAKKVIITAPAKDPVDLNIVLGVNEKEYKKDRHHIISNASCTTNCLAPVAKIIHDHFTIQKGSMTTIHSYTNDQRILDLPHKDLRRARSAGQSMIPTTTGAAKALAEVIPSLKDKFDGISVRVPTPTVSLVDLTCQTKIKTSAQEINALFKKLSQSKQLDSIIEYSEIPLVSVDYKGNSHSAIIDAQSTQVVQGNLVKILAWYDNEWGYSCRIVDLVNML